MFQLIRATSFAGIVLSFWVPSPFGIAAAIAGASVLLGLAIAANERRARAAQVLSAIVGLIAVGVLLVEGDARRGPRASPMSQTAVMEAQPRTTGSAQRSLVPTELAPSPSAQGRPSSDGEPPRDTAVSTGDPGEHEPAHDFGGVPLPDLGEGSPFEKVAMTQTEMRTFERLFVEYWNAQRELQQKYEAGEIGYDELATSLSDKGDALTGELEAAMGEERVAILMDELNRYFMQLALNPERAADFDTAKVADSPIYEAVDHLVAPETSGAE